MRYLAAAVGGHTALAPVGRVASPLAELDQRLHEGAEVSGDLDADDGIEADATPERAEVVATETRRVATFAKNASSRAKFSCRSQPSLRAPSWSRPRPRLERHRGRRRHAWSSVPRRASPSGTCTSRSCATSPRRA
jgi:hypothetical protein